MNEKRRDGAIQVRQYGRTKVAQSVSMPTELHQRVAVRAKAERVSFSDVVVQALQALLASEQAVP